MDDQTFKILYKKEIKDKIAALKAYFPNRKYFFAEVEDSGRVSYFATDNPEHLDHLRKIKRRYYCLPVQEELPFGD